MSQYEDDGTGNESCPDCAVPRGSTHETWCRNPDAPDNAGLTLEEVWAK